MLRHLMIWGNTREGMSMLGLPATAAWLKNGQIMLISHGAVENNNMPPGFMRFLTDEELQLNGLVGFDYSAKLRLGRKRNDLPLSAKKKRVSGFECVSGV